MRHTPFGDDFPRRTSTRSPFSVPRRISSSDDDDGSFPYVVIEPGAVRQRYARQNTDGSGFAYQMQRSPEDVLADAEARVSLEEVYNQRARDQQSSQRELQQIELYKNPDYLNYVNENRKREQARWEERQRRKAEKEQREREIMEELERECREEQRKERERILLLKLKQHAGTESLWNQLLEDLGVTPAEITGCGYRINFSPSRSSLYSRGNYLYTILFYGVHAVDGEYQKGRIRAIYTDKCPDVVDITKPGMNTWAKIYSVPNSTKIIVDVVGRLQRRSEICKLCPEHCEI